jgi:hypothetical protein
MIIIRKLFSRAGCVAQVVEHLPSKCQTLTSNSSTAKKILKGNNLENLDPECKSDSFLYIYAQDLKVKICLNVNK